jgi:hypothetical protein
MILSTAITPSKIEKLQRGENNKNKKWNNSISALQDKC